MAEGQLLSHPLALAVGRNGPAGIRFLLPISIRVRTGSSLARDIDELLEMGIILKAGLDEILCSVSIDLEKGLFFGGLRDPCRMENEVDACDSLLQGGLITAVSEDAFNREIFNPSQIARFPEETTDLRSLLKKGFNEMASDESGSARNQNLQWFPSSLKIA
jgi:hypothetical protein